VHFNQLLSFYQTNQMHIQHAQQYSMIPSVHHEWTRCTVYPFLVHTRSTKITDYPVQTSTTDVLIRNITFSYFWDQFKQNFNNISNIDDLYSDNRHCILITLYNTCIWGQAVWQLVAALRYKLEGRGFDSRWWHWISHGLNPSGRTMALGSTQLITETRTRPISWA
jgi:hypothetical protein